MPPSIRPPLAQLFVTNLRLLDLDTLSDWPDITPRTFSTKDALSQNQKSRIGCAEWALFRLFELWDSEEARDKLQPFFPPLEPLQSLNLRAALFRLLNELKKNGVLGRETILRKTMLDECKGEKFLEVLVIFSTAVMKKYLVPPKGPSRSHVMNLALSPLLNAAQQGSLIPLAIAHRVSLDTLLRSKADTKARVQQFADLLDKRTEELSTRLQHIEDAQSSIPEHPDAARVEREVLENWPGNSKWPKTILYGEEKDTGDHVLQQPFSDAWLAVISGKEMVSTSQTVGLVQNLDHRVSQQKARLRKWRAFHEDLVTGSNYEAQDRQPRDNRVMFDFHKHMDLQIDPHAIRLQKKDAPIRHAAFDGIIAEVKHALADVTNVRSADKEPPVKTTRSYSRMQDIQERQDFARQSTKPRPEPSPSRALSGTVGFQGRNTAVPLSRIFSPARTFLTAGDAPATATSTGSSAVTSSVTSPIEEIPQKMMSSPKVVLPDDMESENTSDRTSMSMSVTSGDEFGEDAIASMMHTHTSVPSRMSLADRTRLSMFRANSHNQSEEEDALNEQAKNSAEIYSATTVIANGPSVADRRQSLLERTQLSMQNLAANPNRRSSLAVNKKRQSRQSIVYPVNQFETPGRPRPPPLRDATPTEKLFAEDAEYNSIFRSRPRIAQSPQPSPDVPEDDNDLPHDDAIYEDPEDEDDIDGSSWIRSSPLRGRG